MKQAHVLSESEKREYFRIDDVAVLQYRQVSEQEVNESDFKPEQQSLSRLTIMAHFDNMTREIQTLSKVISKSNSNIAHCLEMIDRKVNMIGEFLVANEMSKMEVEPQYVNIGAGGLSFCAQGAIITGGLLEIRMVLLPEHVGVFSYAKVISCAAEEDCEDPRSRYRISVEFINMDDEVRDLITRHVLHREREQRMEAQD